MPLQATVRLGPGELSTALYLSDLQFRHLGARGPFDNPLIREFTPVADRNIIATETAALYTDALLAHAEREHARSQALVLHVCGDVADTPCQSEIGRLESVLDRHQIPVATYTRGNHSSANFFGVINLLSGFYRWLRRKPFFEHFSLEREMEEVAGGAGNVLDARGTFHGIGRILHRGRLDVREVRLWTGKKLNFLNLAVQENDLTSYLPLGDTESIPFDPNHLESNFETFWRQNEDEPGKTQLWECMVNAELADQAVNERRTKVTPFYIQAAEQVRFRLEDHREAPLYTITLDGVDHRHFFATNPGISALQLRVVETFIEKMTRENPNARFKINCHFPVEDLMKKPWRFWRRREFRRIFKELLAREEVILYICGHTHERAVTDLNKTLKLGRKTALQEVRVPSLIDYHPVAEDGGYKHRDARAILVEHATVARDASGRPQLKLELAYRGLNRDDIAEHCTEAVDQELRQYAKRHGYIRAMETVKMLRNQHIVGWMHSHAKRLWELITIGFHPTQHERRREYWHLLSLTKYLVDNLTVLSTVNMFNEAYHLLPFLASLTRFIEADHDPEELAVCAQLEGLRSALLEEYVVRRHEFAEDLAAGECPSALREYNDLFRRVGAHRLSNLLLALKPGSQAWTFALLAAIDASRGEFEYHKHKPTKVLSEIGTITVPLS